MKKWCFVLALSLCLTAVSAVAARAGEIDVLLDKLVDKGFLTASEAAQVRSETQRQVAREGGQTASSFEVPGWVKNIKLKGDFRLRNEYARKQSDEDPGTRGRIRYRLGLETKINDQTKVAAGLASGGSDPRSTNQTFTDTFSTPDIRLDYAYAEYKPTDSVSLVGGIFPRSKYLWTPTDMLWDGDIRPQGGALHWEQALNDQWTPYLNTGVFVTDEISSRTTGGADPFLYYTQGGMKFKEGDWSANVAGVYYNFNGLQGTCPDWSAATNTGITSSSGGTCTGALTNDYDSGGVSAELALANPFGMDVIPMVGIFGDYIRNVDNIPNNKGWSMGAKIGHKKVKGPGDWQLKYIFAALEKDAFVDFTPDSDRYGGRTDVRSHEGILEYGLNKNIIFGLDYYQSNRIKAARNLEHVLQTDVVLKF